MQFPIFPSNQPETPKKNSYLITESPNKNKRIQCKIGLFIGKNFHKNHFKQMNKKKILHKNLFNILVMSQFYHRFKKNTTKVKKILWEFNATQLETESIFGIYYFHCTHLRTISYFHFQMDHLSLPNIGWSSLVAVGESESYRKWILDGELQ